jgi:hypothetical protein
MLDINDIVWYSTEIRHQIEKKRYHNGDSPHPLLKYVRLETLSKRSGSISTNDASTTSYALINALSSVVSRRVRTRPMIVRARRSLGQRTDEQQSTFATVYLQSSATISDGMCRNDREVLSLVLVSFVRLTGCSTVRCQRHIPTRSHSNHRSKFLEYLRRIRPRIGSAARLICTHNRQSTVNEIVRRAIDTVDEFI